MFPNRQSREIFIKDTQQFKDKIIFWGSKSDTFVAFDTNNYNDKYGRFDFMAFQGVNACVNCLSDKGAFSNLSNFSNKTKDWIIGYFSYDLKNDIESLYSNNYDNLNFSSLYFFQPKKIFILKGNILNCIYIDKYFYQLDKDIEDIHQAKPCNYIIPKINLNKRISKKEYIDIFNHIKYNINRGNIYEINFCMELFCEDVEIPSPEQIFNQLNKLSNMPMSAFCKFGDKYALCLSPERFISRDGKRIISQPIKGTAKAVISKVKNKKIVNILKNDPKEIKENIMTVDMVRNDLSKMANDFSVKVEELCKVYSYNQINQIVSTVSSQVNKNISSIDIIKSTFPMASMTGVPKNKAMDIIENYEKTKRGLYSGALGYFTPQGDFDLNVVIRTILYNKENNYLSYSVGSAITDLSSAEKEYDECILKAKLINEFFSGK